jgi:GDP-4-dehydro-6-deoxy-D-mannose reductase
MSLPRILVTGADGFVGRHLRPVLATAFPGAEIQGTGGVDITNRAAVFAAVAAALPTVCVHLAGIAAVGQALADQPRAWAVNLHGALNLADAILAHAPDCRLIFISSAEVYGGSFKAGVALDETAALAPMNLYAATKAAAELALGAMAGNGLRLLRLRPFNHTGPGQAEAFVVPAFAGQIARIEAGLAPPVIAVGALRPARDFLDVRDVCAAYAACVQRAGMLPDNAVLNIASGRAVMIGDILQMLLDQARVKIAVEEDPARLRAVEIERAVGDAGLAERLLGWRPRIALEETLAGVLAAARAACGVSDGARPAEGRG